MKIIIAFIIMIKAHYKQKDKAGKLYIFHPLTVAYNVKGYKEKIVALLHDVIEDSDYKLEYLKKYFDKDIVEAVDVLTKKENIEYQKYLEKIKLNNLARKVKLEDLKHNSNLNRLNKITEKDIKRQEKYLKSIIYLQS